MQIVSRSNLAKFMVSPAMDPVEEFQEELSAIASAILAHAPPSVLWFVYTDDENGDDAEVGWHEGMFNEEQLINAVYNSAGSSYYGCTALRSDYSESGLSRVIYYCYVGGSSLQSGPGFRFTTAEMVELVE